MKHNIKIKTRKVKVLSQKAISILLSGVMLLTQLATPKIAFAQGGSGVTGRSGQEGKGIGVVLVDETIFSGSLKDQIERFAKDVNEGADLEETLVLTVIPEEKPENIAYALEALYLEKSLKGIVLIGNVPMPSVGISNAGMSNVSIFPYTDFEDKAFIFDTEKNEFIPNPESKAKPTSEIWHGVIPGGAEASEKLSDFFEKNHAFHTGEYGFDQKLLYSDLVYESRAITSTGLQAYKNFLENIEDFAYNRFTRDLFKKVSHALNEKANVTLGVNPTELSDADLASMPEIQFKNMIEKYAQKYVQLFSAITGKINDFVSYTGRFEKYDTLYKKITVKDDGLLNYLRLINDLVEKKIDDTIAEKQRNIPMLRSVYIVGDVRLERQPEDSPDFHLYPLRFGNHNFNGGEIPKDPTYDFLTGVSGDESYLFGNEMDEITNISQCSLIRGSTQKVEANMLYNPHTAPMPGEANPNLAGCHGGNIKNPERCNRTEARDPIFDIAGTKRVGNEVKINDVRDCFDFRKSYNGDPRTIRFGIIPNPLIDLPEELEDRLPYITFTLAEIFEKIGIDPRNIEEVEKFFIINGVKEIPLEEKPFRDIKTLTLKLLPQANHTLSSVVYHKEPTNETISAQLKSQLTEALPVDADRYVTYLDDDNNHKQIVYPNIFRMSSFDEFKNKLIEVEEYLGEPDLFKDLLTTGEAGIKDYLYWKNLGLEEKYYEILKETVSRNSYEAFYLVGEGENDALKFDFSSKSEGEIPDIQADEIRKEIEKGKEEKDKETERIDRETEAREEAREEEPTFVDAVPLLEYWPYLKNWFEKEILERKNLDTWFPAYGDSNQFREESQQSLEREREKLLSGEDARIAELKLVPTSTVFNADSQKPLKVRVEAYDENGELIEGIVLKLTLELNGPGEIVEAVDENPEREGFQLTVFDPETGIKIQPKGEGRVIIVAQTREGEEGAEATGVEGTAKIEFKKGLSVAIQSANASLKSDGLSETEILVTTDAGVNGIADLRVSDEEMGKLKDSKIEIKDGEGRTKLYSGKKAGDLIVKASMEGFIGAEATIKIISLEPFYISLSESQDEIIADIRDINENIVTTDFETNITFALSESSKKYANLSVEEVKVEKGTAKTKLIKNGKVGPIYIVVRAENLKPAGLELKAVKLFDNTEWDSVNSKVLYVSLDGFASKTFAEKILFSGKTEAVTYQTKIEDSFPALGKGFADNDKHMLLFAAGQTVGEATKFYNDINTLNLGDPTVKIDKNTSKKTGANHTTDVGQQIYSTSKNIDELLRVEDDILTVENEKEIVSVSFGKILQIENGILAVTSGDFNGDSKDDLILVTKDACVQGENCLYLYENHDGKFERKNLNLSLTDKLTVIKIADLNKDGQKELIVSDAAGSIKIYYGKDEGPFEQTPDEIGNLGIKMDQEKNLNSELFISYGGQSQEGLEASDKKEFLYTEEPTALHQFVRVTKDKLFKDSEKVGIDVNGEYLKPNDIVEYRLTIKNKTRNGITVSIADTITGLLELDESSIKCLNCSGDELKINHTGNDLLPIVISGITVPGSGERIILYQTKYVFSDQTPKVKIFIAQNRGEDTDDEILDIVATPEGNSSGQVMYYSSRGLDRNNHVIYEKNLSASPEKKEAAEPDLTKVLEQYKALQEGDSDEDGLPDSWDSFNYNLSPNGVDAEFNVDNLLGEGFQKGLDEWEKGVEDFFKNQKCSGGCIPTPVNMAFFSPGDWNVFGQAVPFDPGLPVLAYPVPGYPPIWPAAPQWYPSTFRLYLSPTLTGEVVASLCMGAYASPTKLAIQGACFSYKLPLDKLLSAVGAGDVCDKLAEGMNAVVAGANQLIETASGELVVNVGDQPTQEELPGGEVEASGGLVNYNMGSYTIPATTKSNFRIPGFPAFFTDWLDRQIEQITTALFDAPDIYFILPDLSFSGMKNLILLQAEEDFGDIKFSKNIMRDFLTILNSIPLLQLESKEVIIKVPTITKKEVDLFVTDAERWWADEKAEANRFFTMMGCGEYSLADLKPIKDMELVAPENVPPREAVDNICGQVHLELTRIKQDIEHNIRVINEYLMLPHKIIQYQQAESFYIRQIIGYLDAVSNFFGGYMKRQSAILKKWQIEIKKAKDTIDGWKGLLNVYIDFEASCDECKTHRFTLIALLMELFAVLPDLPVIPIPHIPDITVDVSKWQLGAKVMWPELSFKPETIVLPRLPRIYLPQVPDVTFTFPKLVIPRLPAPPDMPQLPSLPNLPMPVLPNLPLPPRLPDISAKLKVVMESIGKILKIFCLIYKGIMPVPENSLKTRVEAMTARGLSPVSPLDLKLKFNSPGFPFEYPELIEVFIKGKVQFETDFILKAVEGAALKANSYTTNFVRVTNTLLQELDKTLKGVSEVVTPKFPGEPEINLNEEFEDLGAMKIEPEQKFIDPKKLIANGDIEDLKKRLKEIIKNQPAVTQSKGRLVSSLTTEANTKVVKIPLIASRDMSIPPAEAKQTQAAPAPTGLFVNGESVVKYPLKTNSKVPLIINDVDEDGDDDLIYASEGGVFFKENLTKNENEDGSERIATEKLEDYIPVLPAIDNFQTKYEGSREILLSWTALKNSNLNNYEISYENAGTGDKESITVAANETSFELKLEEGTYYAQIRGLTESGEKGPLIKPILMYPTICNDKNPPVPNLGQTHYTVAVGEEISLDASGSFDAESSITEYWLDMDLTVDTDNDGDSGNDKNIVTTDSEAVFKLDPFEEIGIYQIKLWVEDEAGNNAGIVVEIEVVSPKITLDSSSPRQGFLEGQVTPVVRPYEFAAIRKRARSPEVLGKYKTDENGNYHVDLNLKSELVVKNYENKIVARISRETGNIVVEDERYYTEVLTNPTRTVLKDKNGAILVTIYYTTDVNTDVSVFEKRETGISVIDTIENDEYTVGFRPGDSIEYPGAAEITRNDTDRAAIIEPNGNIQIFDNRVSIRQKKTENIDDKVVYEVNVDKKVIAEIMFGVDPKVNILETQNTIITDIVPKMPERKKWAGKTMPFDDIPLNYPERELLKEFYKAEILEGYKENGQILFKPRKTITRAEFAKIILKILCITPRDEAYKAPAVFNDILFTDNLPWFYDEVKENFLQKFIQGYLKEKDENGLTPFKPLNTITRAEATKIVLEALKSKGILNFETQQEGEGEAWYAPYIRIAQDLKPYLKSQDKVARAYILTKEEALDPRKELTREEFIKIAARVLSTMNCHLEDRDRDQMPDFWERENILNPEDPLDAELDNDSDKLSNVEEFNLGTDPNNPDTDGGGVDDYTESMSHTNPVDAPNDNAGERVVTPSEKATEAGTETAKPELEEGFSIEEGACNSCPCPGYLDDAADLVPGDEIFTVIGNKDLTQIYSQSEIVKF